MSSARASEIPKWGGAFGKPSEINDRHLRKQEQNSAYVTKGGSPRNRGEPHFLEGLGLEYGVRSLGFGVLLKNLAGQANA